MINIPTTPGGTAGYLNHQPAWRRRSRRKRFRRPLRVPSPGENLFAERGCGTRKPKREKIQPALENPQVLTGKNWVSENQNRIIFDSREFPLPDTKNELFLTIPR